jgi:hypothetical protein
MGPSVLPQFFMYKLRLAVRRQQFRVCFQDSYRIITCACIEGQPTRSFFRMWHMGGREPLPRSKARADYYSIYVGPSQQP